MLCAAVLSCALLAPSVAAVESEVPSQPSAPVSAERGATGVAAGRSGGAAANGSGRSVRQRGAAAPVELSPRPEPTPEPKRGSALPRSPRDDAPRGNEASGGDRRQSARMSAPSRVWPIAKDEYTFTQPFGCVPQLGGFYRTNPDCPADSPAVHGGIDLAAPEGTRIYAAASGWVTEAGLDREVGLANTRLIIQHDGKNDGYATEYLHWITSYVRVGDYVRAGEPIAEVGSVGWSTGPHLHFAVIEFDTGDYADPVRWLPGTTDDGVYRRQEPNRRPQRFNGVSANKPEHADPAPPPPPTRERVPESPPANSGGAKDGKRAEDRAKRQRKAERREQKRAERADERAVAAGAPMESGERGSRSADVPENAPSDATDVPAGSADESGEPADAGAAKERKRDRAGDDDARRDGKQRKDRGSDSGRGDGDKDKRYRDKGKDDSAGKGTNGKGNTGRDGNGGKKDGKDNGDSEDGKDNGGKKRDNGANAPVDPAPPAPDPEDVPGEPGPSADETTEPGTDEGTTPNDSAKGEGDTSEPDASPPADEASDDAVTAEQDARPRKQQHQQAAATD